MGSGGIYEGPDGEQRHGDGRPVASPPVADAVPYTREELDAVTPMLRDFSWACVTLAPSLPRELNRLLATAARGVHPQERAGTQSHAHEGASVAVSGAALNPVADTDGELRVESGGTSPSGAGRGVHPEGTASVTSEAVAAGTLPEVLRLRRAKMQRMFRDLREGVSRGAPSEILAEDFAALETFCVAQFHERSERPQDVQSRVHTPAPTEKRLVEIEKALNEACGIIEVGDQRLLAGDGPVGSLPPDISLAEWRRLYLVLDRARAKMLLVRHGDGSPTPAHQVDGDPR